MRKGRGVMEVYWCSELWLKEHSEDSHSQQEEGGRSRPSTTRHALVLNLELDLIGILTLGICKERETVSMKEGG